VLIRTATEKDISEIERMYREQGFEYELPDLTSPLFVLKTVAENGRKRPEMAVALRLTAETFFFINRNDPPQDAARMFMALHEETRRLAENLGLDDVQAMIPPELERKFGHQLKRIGWKKQLWPLYSREVR